MRHDATERLAGWVAWIMAAWMASVGVWALAQTAVTLQVRIADPAVYAEVEDALCAAYGYVATVPLLDAQGQPVLDAEGKPQTQVNPESRRAFVRRQIKRWLLAHREAHLDGQAAESGRAAARAARKVEAESP